MSASNIDQFLAKIQCGDYTAALPASGAFSEYARTMKVGIELRRLKVEHPTQFADAPCSPTLESYLDKIDCQGDTLSEAEALFIECQIQAVYLALA